MDTHLAALRQYLFDARAMQSNGTTDNERARRSLNRAAKQMADEVPTAFVPDEEHAVILPVFSNSLLRVAIGTDARVAQITPVGGGSINTALILDLPAVDGTWDGVMHLEIIDADGVMHRRQSREWWRVSTGIAGVYSYFVSLDRPWPETLVGDLSFRAYQPEFYLRSDVKNVLGPMRIFGNDKAILGELTWRAARNWGYEPNSQDGWGQPYEVWQTKHVQIPAPTEAPTIAVDGAAPPTDVWVGPWQEGTFDIVYTYCWGLRDAEWQSSGTGVRDPLWESAPSPSTTFQHTGSTAGLALRISAVALDQEFGWYVSGGAASSAHGRGGFFLRVYARRTATRTAGLGSINSAETSNRYYLLGHVDPINDSPTYFRWNGSIPIDHSRPLAHSTGYYGYAFWPRADERYEIDVHVSRAVQELIDDRDVLPIRAGRPIEALMELAAYHHALLDGVDQASAERHFMRYKNLINEVRSQQTPIATVHPRGYRTTLPRRRWQYTS